MPRTKAHLQFQKWGEEYGSIYSLVLGTQVMIVLNTAEAVRDLMDKRSAIYSSRPKMHLAQDLLSGGLRFQLQVSITSGGFCTRYYHANEEPLCGINAGSRTGKRGA